MTVGRHHRPFMIHLCCSTATRRIATSPVSPHASHGGSSSPHKIGAVRCQRDAQLRHGSACTSAPQCPLFCGHIGVHRFSPHPWGGSLSHREQPSYHNSCSAHIPMPL